MACWPAMRFHGLMLVRDEADVLRQTLDHLLTWADTLHVLDMGSTDGTWDVVQDYAAREPGRVVPMFSRPIVYSDTLRSLMFHRLRGGFDPGDWVMKIDADEFYHVPPPRFVRERVRPAESAVHLQWYFFRLTTAEVADYESGRVSVAADRLRPIADRRRYYKASTYAEPRMFRYRRTMRWPESGSSPFNAGLVARERIPIRHYPHRDPPQMDRRFQLRAAMMRANAFAGNHWRLGDWREEVVDAGGSTGSAAAPVKVGLAGENGIDVGPLHYWSPGTPFPEVPLHNHVPPLRTRLAQRVAHGLLLPVLDRTRQPFDPAFEPTPIPDAGA